MRIERAIIVYPDDMFAMAKEAPSVVMFSRSKFVNIHWTALYALEMGLRLMHILERIFVVRAGTDYHVGDNKAEPSQLF